MTTENIEPAAAPEELISTLIGDPPVAPAAPLAAPATPADAAFVYEATGDVGLDMALDFMGKQGIGTEHPAMKAAQDGDFSILRATLAAKGTAGWEQFVALGEAAYARNTKDHAEKQAKDQAAVFELAGGKESWLAVQKWAGENATPEEKAEINTLLSKGGIAAAGAVNYLLSAYSKAGNVVRNPSDVVGNAGRTGGVSRGETGPLTAREYTDAVVKLNMKLGGRIEDTQEYASLQQRRALGASQQR